MGVTESDGLWRENHLATNEVSAFVWTDRGIYSHDEKIFIHAILRNGGGSAPAKFPMELSLVSPGGKTVARKSGIFADDFGAVSVDDFSVGADLPSGKWTIRLSTPGKDGRVFGSREVKVEEFAPPTIRVKVEADKKIAEQNAALAVQQADMKVKADTKKAEADAAYSIQQENQRKIIEIAKTNADIARREKEAELAEKEIAIKERELDAEIKKQADAMKYRSEKEAEAELISRQREADARQYEALRAAEAKKAEAEALRYAMEQEAEGIRAKGLAEAEAIEKKAEAQKKMGEASVLEMYLMALPEVVKNAAIPLAKTDKIVMYGDGNSTKLVRDVMNSADQIMEGVKESTGIDISSLLAGFVGGKAASAAPAPAEKVAEPTEEDK